MGDTWRARRSRTKSDRWMKEVWKVIMNGSKVCVSITQHAMEKSKKTV